LLLPAIGGALRRAREATVTAEITQMATALADFKNRYGVYPPSRILLVESGNYSAYFTGSGATGSLAAMSASSTVTDIRGVDLAQRSISFLRKMFPRVELSTTGNPTYFSIPAHSTEWYDFNGNGTNDGAYILDGRECLVFFLGGIPSGNNGSYGMTGFGKSTTNPFSNSIVGNAMYSANRNPPLFEFRGDRLELVNDHPSGYLKGTNPNSPAYVDPVNTSVGQRRHYAYFSAYGGSYDPNDVNVGEADDSGTILTLGINVPFTVYDASGSKVTTLPNAISEAPNPYTVSTPQSATVSYQNPNSFQIISAGVDGNFGWGGVYSPSASTVLPQEATSQPQISGGPAIRTAEQDNLTNFHAGKLE